MLLLLKNMAGLNMNLSGLAICLLVSIILGWKKTYRSTDPRYSNVPIKEMFWHLHDDLNLTCWFHYKDEQWRVFSYIFWPPGAVF
ncbi:Uncharacterised protein [Salmonella enterica subsp. enterica]|nr:Uncharacterised protein [Salmonella enterica subsp. enterica]